MTICQNTSNPNRNDTFGRNGYTALCPLHKNRLGQNKSYMPISGTNKPHLKSNMTQTLNIAKISKKKKTIQNWS